MSKAKNYTSNILDDILNQTTKDEAGLIEYRMLLAAKIDKAIKAKGWKKKDLAEATKKSRSTITQWLSGAHNFTSDTLWELGKILDINLLNIYDTKQTEQVKVYHINISSEIKQTSEYANNQWLNGYSDLYNTDKLKTQITN